LADAETFGTLDRLLARRALGQAVDFWWCTAPGCGNGQEHVDGENAPMFQCAACGHQSCIKHNVPWHEGQSCTEYDEDPDWQQRKACQQREDGASERAVNRTSKPCPGRNCGRKIHKTDGCDHMPCSSCEYQSCWRCLADPHEIGRAGSSAHKQECPHWRRPGSHQQDHMHDPLIDRELGAMDHVDEDPEIDDPEIDDEDAAAAARVAEGNRLARRDMQNRNQDRTQDWRQHGGGRDYPRHVQRRIGGRFIQQFFW